MVIEAQTEIAFVPQNSGGPLNVTKMLAAIDSNISDTRERAKVDVRTYLQRHGDTSPDALKPYHRRRDK
jgi:hypothetical protein